VSGNLIFHGDETLAKQQQLWSSLRPPKGGPRQSAPLPQLQLGKRGF
jgi:hypothetical protein